MHTCDGWHHVHLRNKADWTPLHYASSHGCLDVLQLLLECRADADAQDNERVTPLHLAVANGKTGLRDFCSNMAQASMPGTRTTKHHSRKPRRRIMELLREHMLR